MVKIEAVLESEKRHLALLRGKFSKCQKRNLELESQITTRGGTVNKFSLPASLSKQAQSLFKNTLSEIEFQISEKETFSAHRFLLAARSFGSTFDRGKEFYFTLPVKLAGNKER